MQGHGPGNLYGNLLRIELYSTANLYHKLYYKLTFVNTKTFNIPPNNEAMHSTFWFMINTSSFKLVLLIVLIIMIIQTVINIITVPSCSGIAGRVVVVTIHYLDILHSLHRSQQHQKPH